MTVDTEQFSLEAFDNDFKEFDADFVELSQLEGEVSPEDDETFSELDQEFSGTDLVTAGVDMSSISALAENEVEVAFIGSFIRRKVRRLIRKLYSYARRYSRCKTCTRKLISAIKAYKTGRVFTALYRSYQVYRCFRSCARRA